MKPIKEFSFLDFEKDPNALISFLSSYGHFDKLIVKNINENLSENDKYVTIERELLNLSQIKTTFTNVEIIDDESILCGNLKLVIS